jgi:Beta-lactamase enzyme family
MKTLFLTVLLIHFAWGIGATPARLILDRAVKETLSEFSGQKLQSNELAVAFVNMMHPEELASFRGEVPIYPASVVKLFYLFAGHDWMEKGKLQETAELRRAMRDMIVDSSNDATHYLVDLLTETTAGPELPNDDMIAWSEKRNAVNRYFAGLGYTNCNINQKPWGDGPYGRERAFLGRNFENRNALTVNAIALLLRRIVDGSAVSRQRSERMMELLKRDPWKTRPGDSCEPDQALDFTGIALPKGSRLWSKAGWTSTARHDAAYIELPDGSRFVLVIFTSGHASERNIIPAIARRVIEGLHNGKP